MNEKAKNQDVNNETWSTPKIEIRPIKEETLGGTSGDADIDNIGTS